MSPPQSPAEPTESQDPETLMGSEPPLNPLFPTNGCRTGTDSKRLKEHLPCQSQLQGLASWGFKGTKERLTWMDTEKSWDWVHWALC